MFFGRDTIPPAPLPAEWTGGPVVVGPMPAELRMKALDSVQHLRDRLLSTEDLLAEAEKVYVWLMNQPAD